MKERKKTTLHLQYIFADVAIVLLRSFISALFLYFFSAPSLLEIKFYRNFFPLLKTVTLLEIFSGVQLQVSYSTPSMHRGLMSFSNTTCAYSNQRRRATITDQVYVHVCSKDLQYVQNEKPAH